MDKPNDVPQWAWDEALHFDRMYECLYGDSYYLSGFAKAILKAKNDAYEEVAEMIDTRDYDKPLYEETHSDAMDNLSQAIRNLKHKEAK